MRREVVLVVLALLVPAMFLGCVQKGGEKEEKVKLTEITDSMGRKVRIKTPVNRVVITFNVEEFLAVGGEDALKKIVGWSQYYWKGRRPTVWKVYSEKYPWIKDIPDVGYPWKGTFSAEKVIELRPDVVIMSTSQYKYVKEDLKKLEEAGIPVVFIDYYEPFNISAHTKSTLILGKLLGKEDRAKKLVDYYTKQVEDILKRLKEIEGKYPKPKVLLLGKGWTTYGRNHYRGKMIERAGGINIAAKVLERSGEISPEYVLKENPDVVIFIGKKGWNIDLGYRINASTSVKMLKEAIKRPGWENINAVKNKRVYAIHIYFVHGHIYDFVALQYFVKWFYPEAFKDLDPEKSWKEFHKKFLPVEYSGTWAIGLRELPKIEAKTITVKDLVGREVKVKVPVNRVVTLFYSMDYIAVGGKDGIHKLVGLNAWRLKKWRPDWWQALITYYPQVVNLPDVGQPGRNFNVEEVIKLKPDVVIASRWQYGIMKESGDLERLEKAGIPVVFIDYHYRYQFPNGLNMSNINERIEQVEKSTMILGKLLGKEDRAREIVEFYKKQINIVVERIKGLNVTTKPKVIVFTSWKKWNVYGKTMYHYFIELAGGENLGAKVVKKGWSAEVDPEFVLRENPDVIIFACNNNFPSGQKVVVGYTVNNSTAAKEALKELIDRPGWENLKAVKEKRVYMIHHGLPRHLFDFVVLQYFAKWLHPEVFKDLNPEENLREFFDRFMPLPYHGVWAVGLKELPKVEAETKIVTIKDLVGREVKVKVPVKRVVLLYGLEDYAAVGGEEALHKIVGLNAWRYKKYRPDWWQAWITNYPWIANLPDVGQPGRNFNVEEVIKLKPDVVIADSFMYKYMGEDLKRLEKAGIPVVFTDYFPHSSNVTQLFDEANKSTMILGKLLGKEDRAKQLVEFFEEQVNTVVKRTTNISAKPKAIVFATWSEWRAYGKKGMYNFWIEMAGGENVGAKVVDGFSGDIDPEFVLKENPDVIIFTCNNNFPSGQKVAIGYTVNNTTVAKEALKELIDRPGWENIKAVKEKRVYIIHHGLSHGHIFEFVCLQYIAKWLHPQTFKDLDPEGSMKTFYDRFMPLPYRGVWAVGLS